MLEAAGNSDTEIGREPFMKNVYKVTIAVGPGSLFYVHVVASNPTGALAKAEKYSEERHFADNWRILEIGEIANNILE